VVEVEVVNDHDARVVGWRKVVELAVVVRPQRWQRQWEGKENDVEGS